MPGPPKLRVDAERNRRRIFEAAKDCFAEHASDPSMDEIAQRAGVGVGTLYRAFGSRTGLVEALYADEIVHLEQAAERLAAEAEPWLALTQWLHAYVAAFISKRTMMSELAPLFQGRPGVLDLSRARAAEALDRVLRPAQAGGWVRADLRAPDLLQLVNGVLGAGHAEAGRTELLLSVVLDGMRAREAGR